jgi:hypothetical protein
VVVLWPIVLNKSFEWEMCGIANMSLDDLKTDNNDAVVYQRAFLTLIEVLKSCGEPAFVVQGWRS